MILEIKFPNSPNLGFFVPISFIIIILYIQTAGIVFYRSYIYKKSSQFSSKVFFAYGFLVISYLLSFIFFSLNRFLIWNILPNWSNEYFYILGWYLLGIGGFGASLIFEQNITIFSKFPYLFSSISFILIFISIIQWESRYLEVLSLILFNIINFFILYYWFWLYQKSSRQLKENLVKIMLGFVFGVINIISFSNLVNSWINWYGTYIILYIIQFIGAFLQFSAIFEIRSFSEADWRESLLEIAILHSKTREILLSHQFSSEKSARDSLISSSIKALEDILPLIDNTSFNFFDTLNLQRGNHVFIVLYHKNLIGVLRASKIFPIYSKILWKILIEFNYEYYYLLSRIQNKTDYSEKFLTFIPRIYQIIFT